MSRHNYTVFLGLLIISLNASAISSVMDDVNVRSMEASIFFNAFRSQSHAQHVSLDQLHIQLATSLVNYCKNEVADETAFKLKERKTMQHNLNATWQCNEGKGILNNQRFDLAYTFQLLEGTASAAGVSVNFLFDNWGGGLIIMLFMVVTDKKFKNCSYEKYF